MNILYTLSLNQNDYPYIQTQWKVNDCVGVNCNDGSCIDEIGDFTCSCNSGFSGDLCESKYICKSKSVTMTQYAILSNEEM